MVTRHANTHELPSYQEKDVVKLLLPEQLDKLSRKPFHICQIKTGPLRGAFRLLCEFRVLNSCYRAVKLQPLSPMLWSHYSFPVSPRKVSISEVVDRLRQAPKPHKCVCKTSCSSRCCCVCHNLHCSFECHNGACIPCGHHSATASPHEILPSQPGLSSTPQ
jgi:hypothetical protein